MIEEPGRGGLRCFSDAVNKMNNDAVNKIPPCGVAVTSNSSVCDVCVFHANYGV